MMFCNNPGPLRSSERVGCGGNSPYSETPGCLSLPPEESDEIEIAKQRYLHDPNITKIGLHVGVFQGFRSASTEAAIQRSLPAIMKDSYLPSSGDEQFVQALRGFAFGDYLRGYDTSRFLAEFHTEGGTHANYVAIGIALESLRAQKKDPYIYMPNQTWAAHKSIVRKLGGVAQEYFYVDNSTQQKDFGRTFDFLKGIPDGSFVLLHTCCQNPTGLDLLRDEWKALVLLAQAKNLHLILDSAYLGLGYGLAPTPGGTTSKPEAFPEGNPNLVWDNEPLAMCINEGVVAFVPIGASKTHNLYNKRVGALYVFSPQADQIRKKEVEFVRPLIGSPSSVGAIIFRTIESDSELRAGNRQENIEKLCLMKSSRTLLADLLDAEELPCSFAHMRGGIGMFCLLGTSIRENVRLADEFSVHIPDTGRINLAAVSNDNAPRVVNAIAAVVKARAD